MSKVPLLTVSSVDNSLINNVNTNSATITAAFDNTLSRDGTSPNPMNSTLDMNSHPIINIPFATNPTQPVALGQLTNNASPIQQLTGDVTGFISLPSGNIPTTIATGVVTGTKIANNTITNANIVASTITGGSIANNTITNSNIASATLTGASIASNTVANSNLSNMTANTIKGNNTGSPATPIDLTQTQATAMINQFTSSLSGTVSGSGGGTTNFLRADNTWQPPPGGASSGTLVSFNVYSGSQTITIPATTTKGYVKMWGGTGGSGGIAGGVACASGGTGAGGYLEKYLTGLTAGNTLAYTQGAAGAAGASTPTNGGNGTASTLASGTQIITTLTANGSNGSTAANATFTTGTAGGTATNGDVNITGTGGQDGVPTQLSPSPRASAPGQTLYSIGAYGPGSGIGTAAAGNAGNLGGLIIEWYT